MAVSPRLPGKAAAISGIAGQIKASKSRKAPRARRPGAKATKGRRNPLDVDMLEELLGRLGRDCDRVVAGEAVLAAVEHMREVARRNRLRVSDHDISMCIERLLRLRTSGGGTRFERAASATGEARRMTRQGYISNLSGEFRERVSQNLPGIRAKLHGHSKDASARAHTMGSRGAYEFDSGVCGEVRMPSNPGSGSLPTLDALGPDRLFGFIVPNPKGAAGEFAGELHVTSIVEIKAVTGAHAGVNQTQAFVARAAHGEVLVNGKRYKLVVDENKLRRTVIAPENAYEVDSADAFARQWGIEVETYSAIVEKEITDAATQAVDALMTLERLLRQ